MTEIVVLDPTAGLAERLADHFGPVELAHRWPSGDEPPTVESLVDVDALVAVLGPGLTVDDQLAWAGEIDFARPDVTVIICNEPTPTLIAEALPLGVRNVVAPDGPEEDLVGAIKQAAEAAARRRQTVAAAPASEQRRVITVLSPKGGAGKTTIATNLAVGLAQAMPGQVALVDLDVQFGDAAGALRLTPEHTLADAIALGDRLDPTTLKLFLTPHPKGLFVLCAPESLVEADEIRPDELSRVLAMMADLFPYVVVDTAAGIREDTLATLDVSTDFVLVAGTEVPSVRALQRQIVAFDAVQMTHQRRHFVVNRSNARVGLSIADIENTIGLPVDVALPSSRAVVVSTNQGTPILLEDTREPVKRSFEELVERFLPARVRPPAAANPSELRRRWRSRP